MGHTSVRQISWSVVLHSYSPYLQDSVSSTTSYYGSHYGEATKQREQEGKDILALASEPPPATVRLLRSS